MTGSRPATAAWERLVRARLAETAALREAAGLTRELWAPARARRFAAIVGRARVTDPVLARLLGERAATYVDVGAGTGRYAIPLARAGRTVIAVEPSPGMRASLEGSVPGLTVLPGPWPRRRAAGDVVFAAHVLYLVPDVGPFLDAMTRSARRAGYVIVTGVHSDAVLDPLWRHFHGAPRATNPTFLDVISVLAERGQRATLEIVAGTGGARYRTVAEAVPDFRENLALARDAATTRDLRRVLAGWLVARGGWLRMPAVPLPTAIIRWTPPRRTGETT